MALKRELSTKDITKEDVVDAKRMLEAQMWIMSVLEIEIPGNLFAELQDGTVLCDLLNKIKPGTCTKYKKSNIPFVARNNIAIFIKGARELGVPETDIFETSDLYDKQRKLLSAVVQSIYAISAISRKHGFGGPFIGVAYADANKRHFTKQQLAKSKSAVPMINRGGLKTDISSNHDTYGIIKDANMSKQKFSGVQGVWQKGGKKVEVESNMDQYGIIKTKDNQHTNVQSVWEKGGVAVEGGSSSSGNGMDQYGIIKTKDNAVNSHPNQQSSRASIDHSQSSNIEKNGKLWTFE